MVVRMPRPPKCSDQREEMVLVWPGVIADPVKHWGA